MAIAQKPTSPEAGSIVVNYEQRLNQNARWALNEGSQFFEGKSKVQDALRNITRRLRDLGIPYNVVGGMALFQHGHRRFTEDVDLLVTRDGLMRIHEALDGRGYVPPFSGSKNLRDTETGVKIEFLIAGEFPGDGKPKAISFPDPEEYGFDADGIRYLHLQKLIELKLASGMTNPSRLKDLADVIELIKATKIPKSYVENLDSSVREKFQELWLAAHWDEQAGEP